jgi:two-component system cell cycle sensor histidine kinase/response regulator CckA
MFSQRSDEPANREQPACSAGIHLVQLPNQPDGESAAEETLRKTILLVEDESFVREVTREVLRAAGFSVVAVRSAEEAVRILLDIGGGVDLLLTDVVLPRETGPALAARLRSKDPQMNVLYVTGYAEQMKMLESHRERFLAKPFSSEKLLAAVGQALSSGDTPGEPSGVASAEGCLHDLGRNA